MRSPIPYGCCLPGENHVVRYCSPTRYDDRTRRPKLVTFQLRPSESYWSVYRLEFFEAERHVVALSQLRQHLKSNDILDVSPSGKFLVFNVGLIEEIRIRELTVRSKATPDNPSHAGVEGYTNYDHLVAIALRNLLIEQGEVVPVG